jgi:hypothetical protein
VKDCPKVLASKENRRFVYYRWEVVKAHRRGGYAGKGHQQEKQIERCSIDGKNERKQSS